MLSGLKWLISPYHTAFLIPCTSREDDINHIMAHARREQEGHEGVDGGTHSIILVISKNLGYNSSRPSAFPPKVIGNVVY